LDLPFAALVDGEGKRLIERYLSPQHLAGGFARERALYAPPKTTLLYVADPVESPDKTSVRAAMDRRVPMATVE